MRHRSSLSCIIPSHSTPFKFRDNYFDMYRIHLFNELEMALSTQVCVALFLSSEGKHRFSPKIIACMKYLRNMYTCVSYTGLSSFVFQCFSVLASSGVFQRAILSVLGISFAVYILFSCTGSGVHFFVFLSAALLRCVIPRRAGALKIDRHSIQDH